MGRQYGEVGEVHFTIMVQVRFGARARKRPLIPVRHNGEIDKIDVTVTIEVADEVATFQFFCLQYRLVSYGETDGFTEITYLP